MLIGAIFFYGGEEELKPHCQIVDLSRKGCKMKKFSIVLLVVALLAVSMVSADRIRFGEQIHLGGTGTKTYAASQSFHISHGWGAYIENPMYGVARGEVRLMLDGVELESDFVEFETVVIGGRDVFRKMYIYNFPEGLEGLHHFQLYFSNFCDVMESQPGEWLDGPVECDKPKSIYEGLGGDWWINFN